MAKYPVEQGDNSGQLDAINYLLSGTQGLGQSVQGAVFSSRAFQTGNNVAPFTASVASLYALESLATATWLDGNTLRFDFTTPASVTPYFALGQTLTVSGTTVTQYNITYDSVVQTTTTYVIVKTATAVPNMGGATGGTITKNAGITTPFKYLHTDCFGIASIAGGFDNAVISAQIKNTIQYYSVNPSTLTYTAALNRYKVFVDGFEYDATVAYQTNTATIPTTTNAALTLSITSGTKALTTYPDTYALTLAAAGADLKVNITINASISANYDTTNTTITITNGGYNWTVGDTITIPGTDLGAATPANDLVLTVASVGSFSGNDSLTYETVFTAVKDKPQPGSYVYFLDLSYYNSTGETIVQSAIFDYRSLTAQVIKE